MKKMDKSKMQGNAMLVLTAVIWGTAFVAQRAGVEEIEPATFNAARMVLAAAAAGAAAAIRDSLAKGRAGAGSGSAKSAGGSPVPVTDRKREKWWNLRGGILCGAFLAAASLFQQAGLVYTTAGKAGFITAMYMLLVPVLHFLLFRKKNGVLVWLAVALGIFGLYLLCIKENFSLGQGDALVGVCAVLFSGHILCCDHFASRGDPLKISAVQFAVAALISGAGMLLFETPSWSMLVSAAVPILYCGLISGGMGYTLQMMGQKYTDPAIASLLLSLESVFAAIAGALILGEQMTGREIAGCLILFAAILIVQLPAFKKEHEAEEADPAQQN